MECRLIIAVYWMHLKKIRRRCEYIVKEAGGISGNFHAFFEASSPLLHKLLLNLFL
jgi:hypothetical protein